MSIFHLLDHNGLKALIDKITNYFYTKTETDDLLDDKVDKVNGKGLSTEDYTTAEKNKLGGIEAGAEANVQADWNESDSTADDFIKNKPTLHQPTTDGTAGQYLKSNGSGNAPSWETMDTAPTANSTKAVTSGGVKTALDGKQASVTITTNANAPTDNDTVIMQDNGNTGTTSFLRRKLSTLWNYFKEKADGFYVPFEWIVTNNDNFSGSGGKHLYNLKIDDGFFGANKRWSVTREIFDIESGELITTQNVSQLFDGNFERHFTHPTEGEKEVITITPASGATSLKTYFSGKICLHFYNTKEPLSATLKISVKDTPTTFQTYSFAPYRGKIWRSENFNLTYPHTVIVEIIGKSYTGDGRWVATSLTEMSYFGTRNTIGDESALVKHEIAQEMFGNLTAPKFITKGGTSSQYLRGDGSLTTLSTSPTSGSGLPITSGGVYTALQDKQSVLTITIPDNSGYQVMQLIADVTTSLTTPNYNIAGLVGYLYQWRYGVTGRIAHKITAIGGHDVGNIFLFTDNNASNGAILPYLIKYNDKYYIALKKGSSARSGIRLLGYWTNLLSEPINLYANSTASKWYSDSARTQEITFEITKSYKRYPNAYLDFGGTASQVVLGTGELKTIDSSVASGSSNLVTSGAVATAIAGVDLSGKVNLQPDFTASQIDYSTGNVGKWQKVLRFPEGADLVINMKKTAMGSDSTSTLWFSSSSMGDSYTSLFGNHSVRFVHDGGYVFLVLACRKSTNEPVESYTFQIAHSSVPMSDIVAVTDASPITATPKEPSIVYRAPITTGAVSFNVTNGAGSVAMANHNDFLGNMTSEATNGVTVTMSGATEGQIYRFVFTRNITGGVTFKQSNVAYCTISGDVNAGDTITLTAVSNTADGWLYEQESAGIKSTDGSVNVEYDGGVADLSLNLPPDIVRNNVFYSRNDHLAMAIGLRATCDTSASAVAVGTDSESGNASVAVGGKAKAQINATAYGYEANGEDYSTAIGYQSNAKANSTAVGYQAKAGIPSSDTDRPMLKVYNFEANQFSEGGSSKFALFCETTDDVTITVGGSDYTLTPPAANKLLFVINNSFAQYMTSSVTGYAKLNGEDVYLNTNYYLTLPKVQLSSNYYAVWMDTNANYLPAVITSLSILAYYTTAQLAPFANAIGYNSRSVDTTSSAIGTNLFAVRGNQTVIGCGNIPDYDAWFIVGAGSNSTNGKKNILKIDSNERMVINAGYVGGVQEIDMSQQSGSLSNITKSVYRIRWNDTGTVNLTLGTGGCVEGQRVTIFAETNDVSVSGKLIVTGKYMDFVFIAGDWRAPQDPWQ